MATFSPSRLLSSVKEDSSVIDPRAYAVKHFDIISYEPGSKVRPCQCPIDEIDWDVDVHPKVFDKIKSFMIRAEVQYMWVESLCEDQSDEKAKAAEIVNKYEYFKYADHCHVLLDMPEPLNPREILDNLKLLDHVFSVMACSTLVSESNLGAKVEDLLCMWASGRSWDFDMPLSKA